MRKCRCGNSRGAGQGRGLGSRECLVILLKFFLNIPFAPLDSGEMLNLPSSSCVQGGASALLRPWWVMLEAPSASLKRFLL